MLMSKKTSWVCVATIVEGFIEKYLKFLGWRVAPYKIIRRGAQVLGNMNKDIQVQET